MMIASRIKGLIAASLLGVAAFSISVPAEARKRGFGGHLGCHRACMRGFHHGGFAGRGFGYGSPQGGYYSATYSRDCYVVRRRVYLPWGPPIREQLVCEPVW
jgi:hypothetical protein